MELYALIFQIIECIGFFLLTSLTVARIFFSLRSGNYRIGNMPIVNKQVKFLTSQYIGTCKSTYTKRYALN